MDTKAQNTPAASEERDDSERAQADSPGAGDVPLELLKSLAEASSVSVAFAFVVGWSYLASYYRTFGLNPLELDLPLPVVCTTAVWVLYSAVWPLLFVVALTVGWILSKRRMKRLPRGVTAVFLAVLLFAVSVASILLGRRHADNDMLIDSSALPDVAALRDFLQK